VEGRTLHSALECQIVQGYDNPWAVLANINALVYDMEPGEYVTNVLSSVSINVSGLRALTNPFCSVILGSYSTNTSRFSLRSRGLPESSFKRWRLDGDKMGYLYTAILSEREFGHLNLLK